MFQIISTKIATEFFHGVCRQDDFRVHMGNKISMNKKKKTNADSNRH